MDTEIRFPALYEPQRGQAGAWELPVSVDGQCGAVAVPDEILVAWYQACAGDEEALLHALRRNRMEVEIVARKSYPGQGVSWSLSAADFEKHVGPTDEYEGRCWACKTTAS